MSNWKDMLQKQQEDLDRLEALDAEITEGANTTAAEADKVLKKSSTFGVSFGAGKRVNSAGAGAGGIGRRSTDAAEGRTSMDLPAGLETLDLGELDVETGARGGAGPNSAGSPSRGGSQSARGARPASGRRSAGGAGSSRLAGSRDDTSSELGSPGGQTPTPAAGTDAAARYNKAKVTQLTKALADSEELRRKLQEQNADLQRTLKVEREESKKSRKQIQLLETDARREARRPSHSGAGSSADPTVLAQEVASLRKDLQTAERLAKNADASSVAKDAQVKRATEAVARLKTQLAEARNTDNAANTDDRERAEAAEGRVRVLEKQRGDLVAAFKKQMKLVDVLKRQKMHVEAARLLAFTEEEFVKTLDWSL